MLPFNIALVYYLLDAIFPHTACVNSSEPLTSEKVQEENQREWLVGNNEKKNMKQKEKDQFEGKREQNK